MPSSPESAVRVVRGDAARDLPLAKVDIELRGTPLLRSVTQDARMFDPSLVTAFDKVAEQVRDAAQREGYEAGYAAGLAQAQADEAQARASRQAEFEAEVNFQLQGLAAVTDSLANAAYELESRSAPVFDAAAVELANATMTLVRAILGREPSTPADVIRSIAAQAAHHAPRGAHLTLHLHPQDAETAVAMSLNLSDLVGRPTTLLPDPAVPRGEGVVESGATRVDLSLADAVARVAAALDVDLDSVDERLSSGGQS